MSVGPIFVGGTGRSGTHAMAFLLNEHPTYWMIPGETRLQAEPRGLPGLIEGRASLDKVCKLLRGRYFSRTTPEKKKRGLHRAGVTRPQLEAAVDALEADFQAADPMSSTATFLRALFDPLAEAAGAEQWVEQTPPNVEYAALHQRMFANAGTIHIVRDGRDVAASVARLPWGPTTMLEGLEWWAEHLRVAEAAVGDPARVHVVGFESLVIEDRDAEYTRLLEFLRVPDDAGMRTYFDESLTPEKAHVGRWKNDLPDAERKVFEDSYQRLLDGLLNDGISCAKVVEQRR